MQFVVLWASQAEQFPEILEKVDIPMADMQKLWNSYQNNSGLKTLQSRRKICIFDSVVAVMSLRGTWQLVVSILYARLWMNEWKIFIYSILLFFSILFYSITISEIEETSNIKTRILNMYMLHIWWTVMKVVSFLSFNSQLKIWMYVKFKLYAVFYVIWLDMRCCTGWLY